MGTARLVVVLALAVACGAGAERDGGAGAPALPGPAPAPPHEPPIPAPPTTTPAEPPPVACPAVPPLPIDAAASPRAIATPVAPPSVDLGACAGIDPPSDAPMRAFVVRPHVACTFDCRAGMADANGALALPRILGGSDCHSSVIDFVADSGTVLGSTPLGLYLKAFQQPRGFFAAARSYLGPDPLPAEVEAWESSGRAARATWYQAQGRDPRRSTALGPEVGYAEASAPDPQGGLLVAGDLRLALDAVYRHAALMFEAREGATRVRWGPVALESAGLVLGVGVDVLGRSLVLTDGAATLGAGHVAAQWFDRDGTPLTCAFALLAGFAAPETSPSDRAWLETVPLAGGGLAVRRAEVSYGTSYRAPVIRRYLAVVESGAVRFAPPPAWMEALDGATLQLVRGGRAYAVLHGGGSAASCTQRLEVLAPDGTSCGGRDYPIADGGCTLFPLTVGADGTVLQQLPTALEPAIESPYGSVNRGCTWRWWAGAVR